VKIKVEIDEEATSLEVTVRHHSYDEELQEVLERLKKEDRHYFSGEAKGMSHVFRPENIYYIYTEGGKVKAKTSLGDFEMKEKLYELAEDLPQDQFVRLSKSVIGNLDEIRKFELSFNGTLCVHFKSGDKEYVSRHYVSAIKQAFQGKRRKTK